LHSSLWRARSPGSAARWPLSQPRRPRRRPKPSAREGTAFPFSRARLEAAHAQWTAEWLAWERSHDREYKRRAAEAEHQLALVPSPDARLTLESIEREKLALYQRRYEEYVRVAKALDALAQGAAGP